MFNYTIKIRPIRTASKLKAFASILIDDIMEVDGFKIIDGSKGLFVTPPSHKGTVTEDGVQVEKYFDDIRFPGEEGIEFSNELKQSILDSYKETVPAERKTSAPSSRGKAAQERPAAEEQGENGDGPARARKPLWGY